MDGFNDGVGPAPPGHGRPDRSFKIRRGPGPVEYPVSEVQRTYGPPSVEWPVPVAATAQATERE